MLKKRQLGDSFVAEDLPLSLYVAMYLPVLPVSLSVCMSTLLLMMPVPVFNSLNNANLEELPRQVFEFIPYMIKVNSTQKPP
jgi:hypothetical protein